VAVHVGPPRVLHEPLRPPEEGTYCFHNQILGWGVTRELLDEISKDEKLYDELVRKIAVGIARNDEVRALVLNSIIRDIATKKDIEDLRNSTRQEIEELKSYMKQELGELRDELRKEIGGLRNSMRTENEGVSSELTKEIRGLKEETKREIEKEVGGLKAYVDAKFESVEKRIDNVNERIDDLRSDMRMYFFGFMGGIVATLITIILTKLL
jgi:DNA anti-recombination protein RmuC